MSLYERVAEEYYDASLHPTCANLRAASDAGLASVLGGTGGLGQRYLELGAGDSTLASEALVGQAFGVCIDLNPTMLAYSTRASNPVLADAFALPFGSNSFDRIIGSLIDPFNEVPLYVECHRVMRPGGILTFTVPDVGWVRHNQRANMLPPHSASITLQGGETVILPSFVWDFGQQEKLLVDAGFEAVRRLDVNIDVLAGTRLSTRFLNSNGRPAFSSVISVYEAMRS